MLIVKVFSRVESLEKLEFSFRDEGMSFFEKSEVETFVFDFLLTCVGGNLRTQGEISDLLLICVEENLGTQDPQ